MTDVEILRVVLARELETINEYAALARAAQDPTVKALLMHISRDEEEHVAECIQWISRLNPTLAGFLERAPGHVESAEAKVAPPVVKAADPSPAAQDASLLAPLGGRLIHQAGLTVGSLLKKPLGTV